MCGAGGELSINETSDSNRHPFSLSSPSLTAECFDSPPPVWRCYSSGNSLPMNIDISPPSLSPKKREKKKTGSVCVLNYFSILSMYSRGFGQSSLCLSSKHQFPFRRHLPAPHLARENLHLYLFS